MTLPTHVALSDEPIPALWSDDNSPDMAAVMPIEGMLADLRQHSDDVASYVDCWRGHILSIGGSLSLTIETDGKPHLMTGMPCDSQVRHRSRWLHFLIEDLRADPGRREHLIAILMESGFVADNRPNDPRQTTTAIRNFLRAQGRILIDPSGQLMEGAGVPKMYTHGTPQEVAEVTRASRAYFRARTRRRADTQIKRVVRMLGRKHNGWLILEAPHV